MRRNVSKAQLDQKQIDMKKKNMENAIRHGAMTEELKRVDPAGYQIAYEKVKKIQEAQQKEL